jgi:hypothetical protein
VNPDCATSCAPDCDDLPDHRDPWPSDCNRVLFEDGFSDSKLAKWIEKYAAGSINVKPCGLLQVAPPTQTTATIVASDAETQKLTKNYLLDVGLILPPMAADTWKIIVEMLREEPQGLWCLLDYRGGKNLVLQAGFVSPAGTKSLSPEVSIAATSGELVLQAWHSGTTFTCRLFKDGVPLGEAKEPYSGALIGGGGIQVEVFTPLNEPPAVARFDFVRAFAAP